MLKSKAYEEIKNFKEEIYAGLNTRQLVCGGLGVAVVVGVYLVARQYTTEDMASWICILSFLPFFFIGFREKNGMPYEKYLKTKFKFEWLGGSSKRTFHVENFYESVEKNKTTEKKQKRGQ